MTLESVPPVPLVLQNKDLQTFSIKGLIVLILDLVKVFILGLYMVFF